MDKLKGPEPKPGFTVETHNQILKTLDGIITEIEKHNTDNLELNNAIKDLLAAGSRINKYYAAIKTPTPEN